MNENYLKLRDQYLFVEVKKKIRERDDVIDLSVGDVRLPLPKAVCEAGIKAATELNHIESFRGYPPENGYDFLRQAVVSYYKGRVSLYEDEVFVSDGIKSDMNMFLDLFSGAKVILRSPTYPAYIEANTLKGNEIVFCDEPPATPADLVILCSPDNPTGVTMPRAELENWLRYCHKVGATLIFDAAYESFAASTSVRSIFELDGARDCAVEFCSLSKTAGFTGVRCGYTVICKENKLARIWKRVKACTTNGVSYVTQRMAECALTSALKEVRANTHYYLTNAEILRSALDDAEFCGGEESPYIWLRSGIGGFERLLEFGVGATPGLGFGETGREFVRLNSFCLRSDAIEAAKRLKKFVRSL